MLTLEKNDPSDSDSSQSETECLKETALDRTVNKGW